MTGFMRLAMRREGEWWNAYIAAPNTMDDAMLIGSIRFASVQDPDRKERFIALMQDILGDASEEALGVRPARFERREAPESERSGHG
jgi:hypothetical protein